MALCPHCGTNSIGYFAKHSSRRTQPVRCANCSGLSYLGKHTTIWAVLAALLPFLVPAALNSVNSSWFVVAAGAGFVLLIMAHELTLYRAPLIAIKEDTVAHFRSRSFWLAGMLLIAAVIALTIVWSWQQM